MATPRCEVVEGNGGSPRNYAVEIFREILRRLEALPTSSRASQVIGLAVWLAIISLGDLLSNDDTGMKPG